MIAINFQNQPCARKNPHTHENMNSVFTERHAFLLPKDTLIFHTVHAPLFYHTYSALTNSIYARKPLIFHIKMPS